jgi:two-component system, cell cycle sensor histidine kinase and response regulator CckA
VAVPIRDPESREVLAIGVSQVRLERIAEALMAVESRDGGYAFLLDHSGVVAAHPRMDLQSREVTEYAGLKPLQHALQNGITTLDYLDPISGERVIATVTTASVGGRPWTVVSQQPVEFAQRPINSLIWQLGIACALLALVGGGLGFAVARSHNRLRRFGRKLEHENALRRAAEEEVRNANDNLEELVKKRTSELRSAEEQLQHAQRMEAIGRLAGGIAHDFNNMLSVIIGYSDIVLLRLPADSAIRNEIREIRNAGERAGQLTRQLLAFSRKQVLQPEVLNLNETILEMEKMLKRLIGEDIDLAVHLSESLDRVKFDPGQIEQIILNLVVNARDAMPRGGKILIQTANIELDEEYASQHSDASAGPHVMLAVTDTGSGMDAETRARIFEPFFTTKEIGRGTGLGLSTVYGIVKQSGGNIWVYSEPGHGTTFKIYIPAIQEPSAATKRRSGVLPPVKATGTLLVVEDEEQVRNLIVRVLGTSGFKVLQAAGPEEAMRISAEFKETIDLLLTDVVMPGMGGRTLAEKLCQERPLMRVLYMSGYTDNAIVHHGVLDEGTAFLEKPIRPDSLLSKVSEVLNDTL